MSLRIGILLGSARTNGNNGGIAQWVQHHLLSLQSTIPPNTNLAVPIIPLAQYPLPLGPLYDDIVPQALTGTASPSDDGTLTYPYHSERDKEFSIIVQHLDALVVVTPQYNWSLPGELKNTFDHLFHEWVGLPIAVVTYGGRGGDKCAEAMRAVIGGIKAVEVSIGRVMVPLPRDTHIAGDQRIKSDDELLRPHEEGLKKELVKVVQAAQERRRARSAV